MIKKIAIISLLFFSQFVFSEELNDEKKQVIDEMLEITGALKVGEMMGVAVANQMITALSQKEKNLDPKIVDIIKDEIAKIMHDEFVANRFINEMSYTIYHKYFTTSELKEMVAFYKTPTGAKMASLMPQVSQEGMAAGQKHGQSLGPIIQQRLKDRFEKEGIK
jgi:hypothetical protein